MSLTDAQREAAERVIAAASIGRALDALTDAGFVVLHRDDVTEEYGLLIKTPWRDAETHPIATKPGTHIRFKTRWEPITKENDDGTP